TSSIALAISQITRDKHKAFIVSGAAASDLTGKACSPNTIHWTYDTWALANGTGSAIVKTGGDTWFFLTADYAFGHALERDVEAVVPALRRAPPPGHADDGPGGRVLGDPALPQGGGGAQERRRPEGHRQDERAAHRRPALRQGARPRRRSEDPPDVPLRGEEA